MYSLTRSEERLWKMDGTGGQFSPTTLVTLNGVQTDLATLLANHQLLIA